MLDEATERWGIRVGAHRAEVDRPAGLHPGGHGEADAGRARQARRDPLRRGREAVRDPHRRGRAAVGDPARARPTRSRRSCAPRATSRPRSCAPTGEAEAIRQLFQSIHDGDPTPDLLAYKYLEALPKLAEGQSTKLMLIPSDAMQALGGIAAMGGAFQLAQDVAGHARAGRRQRPRRRRHAPPPPARAATGTPSSDAPARWTATGPRAEGVRWDLSRIVADAAAARDAARRDPRRVRRLRRALPRPRRRARRRRAWPRRWRSSRRSRTRSAASARTPACAARSTSTTTRPRDLEAVVEQGMRARVQRAALLRARLDRAGRRRRRARWLDAPEVARDRHHLRSMRRYKPHRLAEAEERMLAERGPAASTAWQNLFEQTVANVRAPYDDGDGRARPHGRRAAGVRPPPDARAAPAARWRRCTRALEPWTPILAHCYDSLVADRLVLDRLRGYDEPMAARHLDNELDPAAVEAMMRAIEGRYGIAQQWFRHKAGLLGARPPRPGRPVRAARRRPRRCPTRRRGPWSTRP